MKIKLVFTAAVVLWLGTSLTSFSQEKQDEKSHPSIEKLEAEKEKIIEKEKKQLRKEVEAINKQLEDGLFTTEESEQLKTKAAEKHARNIDNNIAIIDNQIELIERNGPVEEMGEGSYISIDFGTSKEDGEQIFGVKIKDNRKKVVFDRRTTFGPNISFGFNNVITQGESFDNSNFKIGGSRFAELGWTGKTRVFKNSNWLRLKYGLAFQFNGLKPEDNQIFAISGDETHLQTFPHHLKKAKFRMDNLVLPLHFEFGPSKKVVHEDYFRYSTFNKPSFGLGGYAGLNISTRQKLKYTEDGRRRKEKIKEDYNTSNVICGISGYVMWRDFGIYAKYDLNPIFTNNPVEQRNISVGIRFDAN